MALRPPGRAAGHRSPPLPRLPPPGWSSVATSWRPSKTGWSRRCGRRAARLIGWWLVTTHRPALAGQVATVQIKELKSPPPCCCRRARWRRSRTSRARCVPCWCMPCLTMLSCEWEMFASCWARQLDANSTQQVSVLVTAAAPATPAQHALCPSTPTLSHCRLPSLLQFDETHFHKGLEVTFTAKGATLATALDGKQVGGCSGLPWVGMPLRMLRWCARSQFILRSPCLPACALLPCARATRHAAGGHDQQQAPGTRAAGHLPGPRPRLPASQGQLRGGAGGDGARLKLRSEALPATALSSGFTDARPGTCCSCRSCHAAAASREASQPWMAVRRRRAAVLLCVSATPSSCSPLLHFMT